MKKPNITFKSLLQPIKDIEERNAYFDYLSDEGKRLEIAWDMLQLLVQEKVKATGIANHYWNLNLLSKVRNLRESKKIQKFLCTELETCTVCARGGMMLSQIRLGNSIDYCWDIGAGNFTIIKGFSYDNFINMEVEYEHSKYNHAYQAGTTEKLMNICCNILVNGNFNTNDRTDYLTD